MGIHGHPFFLDKLPRLTVNASNAGMCMKKYSWEWFFWLCRMLTPHLFLLIWLRGWFVENCLTRLSGSCTWWWNINSRHTLDWEPPCPYIQHSFPINTAVLELCLGSFIESLTIWMWHVSSTPRGAIWIWPSWRLLGGIFLKFDL
jgi:hypothetical protein